MPVALENFIQQLEVSGILAGDTIQDFIPPKASPRDAEDLARELVRQRKLTQFQAEEVYRGRGKSLNLGNYLLIEKIGAGGMGQVFKARHRVMERLVAVKVLPPAMMKNEAAVARFHREVKAAARISHPNIVTAYDADQANGVHFLVMELVDGSDLSALVKKDGPLPLEKAVNFVLQAARGLDAAHKKGIVHRDIKPANLLLDKDGVVKILDMGLARLSLEGEDTAQADLTSTGTIMGTVDYMAPEQALDTKAADARADVYALGCSLYFLLTGKPTYDGDTLMKKLLAHREHPIPALRTIRPEVSEQIETVFRKLVAKKVEDRYQSMTEVIVDLERCSVGSISSAANLQPVTTTFDGGPFDSLKKLPEEPTILVEPRPIAAAVNTGRNEKLTLVGASLLAMAIFAAITVSLRTRDGTLVVEIDQPDANVQVLDDEGKVEINQKGGRGTVSISVDPGKHRLMVEKDGFTVFGQDFEIKSGGRTPIKAILVPLEEKPAGPGTKPAPMPEGTKQALAFTTAGFDQWVQTVGALPAEEQIQVVARKLQELNPGFDGKITGPNGGPPVIKNGVVWEIALTASNVTDISPLRAFKGLAGLGCYVGVSGTRTLVLGELADLSPLKGMQLNSFNCSGTKVVDLSPLRGMPLWMLYCECPELSDLTPLKGMPLHTIGVAGTKVSDLSPLRDLKLTSLNCTDTFVADLSPLKGMALTYLQANVAQISDLSPLQGMPLKHLEFGYNKISNISVLKGMPLEHLVCIGNNIADLSPLKDAPLKSLQCDLKSQRDFEMLRSIKTLATINDKPVSEFWKEVEDQSKGKKLAFQMPGFDDWVKDVQALTAEKQIEAVSQKLIELNPGFDGIGKSRYSIREGMVDEVGFSTTAVTDISPVRALTHLDLLICSDDVEFKLGKLTDLSPLRGLNIRRLNCSNNLIRNLSTLEGVPLTLLNCLNTSVSDITPLQSMKLTELAIGGCRVSNLSPLRGMKLTTLNIWATSVSDLSPLQDMPLTDLTLNETPVSDLSALKGMSLRKFHFTPKNITQGISVIREMKSLETIGIAFRQEFTIEEFWKKYDAGEFGRTTPTKPVANFKSPSFLQWMKDVQAQPAEQQVEAVSKKLMELNPGFDGKVTEKIEGETVTSLSFVADDVTDLAPVRALERLQSLSCCGGSKGASKLCDLSPLEGMKLTSLYCHTTNISDFSPIRNTTITYLHCGGTPIADLLSVRGMRLTTLICSGTNVSDLSPLADMPLTRLSCIGTPVSELSPLKTCKSLKALEVNRTKVTPAVVAALQTALPDCKILWDDSAK